MSSPEQCWESEDTDNTLSAADANLSCDNHLYPVKSQDSNDNDVKDAGAGPSKGSSKLTPEERARMERNRQIAQKRLREKAEAMKEVFAAYGIPENDNQQAQSSAPKRAKKESKYMTDLKNVVSEGSVVRVHGTKLIDTGGGFLIEEKDLVEQEETEKVIVPHVAPFLPTDVPVCLECSKEFHDSFLFKHYEYLVCDSCKDTEEKHKLVTRTDAKNEYLLKDVDFDRREPVLKFMTRPNPHNNRWGDMKLYLRLQVEERALEIWGSLDKIDEQLETREENRMKTKIKKYNKKMKELRMSARSSLYARDFTPHEHSWGPDTCIDEDEDQYKHTCTECGQEEVFEKM